MITSPSLPRKTFAVAPMLDMTDRHCRSFLRLFSRNFRLYTEMKVAGSIIYGDRGRFLEFDSAEHPLALQIGGCNPDELAFCAGVAEQWGYDEINLNVGCPSDRVQNAQFGACLMAKPELVAQCVKSMINAVSIPVTVKTRIGIDDMDSYRNLSNFVSQVADGGGQTFIIHARKAWLKGLSPKENRTIPPLDYETVYRLKTEYPELNIIINGGICNADQIATHLQYTDGVMMGREAYRNPWILREIDQRFFGSQSEAGNQGGAASKPDEFRTRGDLIRAFFPYIEDQLAKGACLWHITRHILGLYHGQPGARTWRRHLSTHGPGKNAGLEVIQQALKQVEDSAENGQMVDQRPTRVAAYA